ncbi:MAG: YjgP/YjgQ family permease [Flavobacteriaceae bacterium]|nr:YjgP/YjgQ family permease [Flavobacteriaceae bacterium]
MKILDKYLLKSFLVTFASVFVILFFIFVLQVVWLFISELAGKDLDFIMILKFLLFKMPSIIPLVLPLSTVLASIMTFGSLAENYEFAAMKSSGISLQRSMRTLVYFITILTVVTFFFANNVIPYAEYKFINFRRNIAQVKPAMAIAEGQFSQVGTYNIKVDKKSGDNGRYLSGVTIHKLSYMGVGSNTVIKAKKGELISSENSNILKLVLKDGNYYEDIIPEKFEDRNKVPFAKSEFKTYVINIDLSKLNSANLDEAQITNTNTMLTLGELRFTLDSLQKNYNKDLVSIAENINLRSAMTTSNFTTSTTFPELNSVNLLENFSTNDKAQILRVAGSNVDATNFSLENSSFELEDKQKNINMHWIAFYDKFVIAFACLLMFFIGAPLGAIIKKGGLGLPIVFAILIFIIFHFINTFGKKVAQEGGISPFIGCWMSSFVLVPLAILLTKRATEDKGFTINFDWIVAIYNRFIPTKSEEQLTVQPFINTEQVTIEEDNDWEKLNGYDNDTLIKIVKEAKHYGYTDEYRNKALKVLESRNITQKELLLNNNLYNVDYDKVEERYKQYKIYSSITLIAYLLLLGISFFGKPETIIGIILVVVCAIFFYITLFKSQQQLDEIGTLTNKKVDLNVYLVILAGFPFFILFYFYNRNYLKEVLSEYTKSASS